MSNDDLDLRFSFPPIWLSHSAYQSVQSRHIELSQRLTAFRGYVVSLGFDIENIVLSILTNLLFLNRPKYKDETQDEYTLFLHSRAFVKYDMLAGQRFRQKVESANIIIARMPSRLKNEVDFPLVQLRKALSWRNRFAHDRIEFKASETGFVVPILKKGIGRNGKDYELSQANLKVVAEEMESCYAACRQLEQVLSTRFENASPKRS